jgi:TM2 domain-containing membrane protein YozV
MLAALASFFFPGAGEVWAGQTVKGAVMLVVALFTCGGCGLMNLGLAYDAYKIAQRRRNGESVGDWQFF